MLLYVASILVALQFVRSGQLLLWDRHLLKLDAPSSLPLAVAIAILWFALRRRALGSAPSRRASSFACRLLRDTDPAACAADAFARAKTARRRRRPPPPGAGAPRPIDDDLRAGVERVRARFPESRAFHSDRDVQRFVAESLRRKSGGEDGRLIEAYGTYVRTYRRHLFVSPLPLVRRVEGFPVAEIFRELPSRARRLTECLQVYERHFLECAVVNRDRQGRPVTWMRGRKLFAAMEVLAEDGPGAAGHGRVPLWLKWAFQAASAEATLLLCEHESERNGRDVRGALQVMDMAGISLAKLIWFARSDTKFETLFSSLFFPGIVDKVVVVNPPRGVALLWTIARPFLPSPIREKVEIVPGGSTAAHLLGLIDADQLPSCYGGSFPFSWPALPAAGEERRRAELLDAVARTWPSDPARAGYVCVEDVMDRSGDERFAMASA